MKTIIPILILVALSGCARSGRWAVASVQNLSDNAHRKIRVEVVAEGQVPWPLNLSVSATDLSKKHIESTMPRWTAKRITPTLVAFELDEPVTKETKACMLDLKITARGHSNLYVHQCWLNGDRSARN